MHIAMRVSSFRGRESRVVLVMRVSVKGGMKVVVVVVVVRVCYW